MSFERIAGPRKGKATANRQKCERSGSVKGSNPGAAGKNIKGVRETFVNKASKKEGRVKDNDTRGTKKFFNPDASN